jgi:hypothetical protein
MKAHNQPSEKGSHKEYQVALEGLTICNYIGVLRK